MSVSIILYLKIFSIIFRWSLGEGKTSIVSFLLVVALFSPVAEQFSSTLPCFYPVEKVSVSRFLQCVTCSTGRSLVAPFTTSGMF